MDVERYLNIIGSILSFIGSLVMFVAAPTSMSGAIMYSDNKQIKKDLRGLIAVKIGMLVMSVGFVIQLSALLSPFVANDAPPDVQSARHGGNRESPKSDTVIVSERCEKSCCCCCN